MFYLKIIKIPCFLKGHIWYNPYETTIFPFIILKNHLIHFTIMSNDSVHQSEARINRSTQCTDEPNVYKLI